MGEAARRKKAGEYPTAIIGGKKAERFCHLLRFINPKIPLDIIIRAAKRRKLL